MFSIPRLKNCPNCGAMLNDFGRCEYCGSKVYDLTDIDVRTPGLGKTRTYLRIRTDYGILVVPVVCDQLNIQRYQEEQPYYDDNCIIKPIAMPSKTTISMEFTVDGDYIKVKEEE